jgi:hypothetical protein
MRRRSAVDFQSWRKIMPFFGMVRSEHIQKYLWIALALAALLVFPGCWVTSINGLYQESTADNPHTDPDLVLEQSLVGSWIHLDDKCTTLLTIASENGAYNLRSTDQGEGCDAQDKPSRYQAHLVKLDTYYFLDIAPMDDAVCNMCLAKHNIFLAKFDKATLSLSPIDSNWLKKSLAAKTVSLATLAGDTDTLTASSADLKSFCRRFAADEAVFKPSSTYTLKRK